MNVSHDVDMSISHGVLLHISHSSTSKRINPLRWYTYMRSISNIMQQRNLHELKIDQSGQWSILREYVLNLIPRYHSEASFRLERTLEVMISRKLLYKQSVLAKSLILWTPLSGDRPASVKEPVLRVSEVWLREGEVVSVPDRWVVGLVKEVVHRDQVFEVVVCAVCVEHCIAICEFEFDRVACWVEEASILIAWKMLAVYMSWRTAVVFIAIVRSVGPSMIITYQL